MSWFLEFYMSGVIVVLVLTIYHNRYAAKKYYYQPLNLAEALMLSLFSWSFVIAIIIVLIAVVIYELFPRNLYARLSGLWDKYTKGDEK